jgi:hypothetical protein
MGLARAAGGRDSAGRRSPKESAVNTRQSRIPAAALVAAAVLALGPTAHAHHSGATFDLKQTVSLEGVVTRYEWANPHVYIWLAAPDASGATVEWELEGQPPAILRRLGWSQDTLGVGDKIQATGNPARNPQRKSLLLASMQRADTTLYDGKAIIGALTAPGAAPAAAADGIAGVWVTLLDMPAMQSYLNLARSVPLTERGTAAKAAFNEATMSSGLQCSATPAPAFMFVPDVKRITVDNDAIRIAGEFGAAERLIHVPGNAAGDGATSARPPATPSVQGHSVGRWDGATLVVETTAFAPHSAGLGFTVPSSETKQLVERLTLEADGKGLAYTFELTDPEMLTAPLTGVSRWVYRPDLEFAPVACDLDNARRFTE